MRAALVALMTAGMVAPPSAMASGVAAFDSNSLARIEAFHRGKPFVLVMWSLDCTYCAASFAALAAAQRAAPLAVEAVATDSADDPDTVRGLQDKVRASGMAARIWAFGDAPPERLRHAIDPRWHGELPRVYWYRADGSRTATSGVVTEQAIAGFRRASAGH